MGDEVQVAEDKAIVMESEWRALTRLLRLIGNVKVEGAPNGDTLVLALSRPVWVMAKAPYPARTADAPQRRFLSRIRIDGGGLRLQVSIGGTEGQWVPVSAIVSVEQWL
jgi:hypothetical protein